jgi:hypothetical protein
VWPDALPMSYFSYDCPYHRLDTHAGSQQELRSERERLKTRLRKLTAGEARIAAIPVDSAVDPDGSILQLMLEWRQQRLRTITAEVERLTNLISGASLSKQASSVAAT